MSIEEKKILTDILLAIKGIDEHLESRRIFEEYKANSTKRRAVERELEIIGEAVNNLLKINPEIPISFARIVVDLRNRIIHAYDNVNNNLIWKIIMKDIPILQQEVQQLLKEE
jgi:uncharacterized protein with HEPN domain